LKRAGLAGAAAAVPAGVLAGEAAAAPEREQLEAFTSDEAATVRAIVERLIPTDASGPAPPRLGSHATSTGRSPAS
jgi:hypothetical protein